LKKQGFWGKAGLLILIGVFVFSFAVEAAPDNELRWGRGTDATSLDPRTIRDVYSWAIHMLVFNSLIYFDDEMSVQLDLAKSMEFPDDTTYLFEIHEGVKFHDGVELTAADIVYTFETMQDEEFGSPYRGRLSPVTSVEALDDYTVKIEIDEPNAPFIYELDVYIVPKHIAPDKMDKEGGFAHQPIGSGPFELINWIPNDRILLERFDDYWEGPAQLEKITVIEIPEADVRLTELRAGNLDLTSIPSRFIEDFQEDPNFTVGQYTTLNWFPIWTQHDHDILSDVRVRQALAYGTNVEEIVDHVYYPTGVVSIGPIIPGTWAEAPEVIKRYDYNPEKARELLAEAGYPDGFEIELRCSSGEANVQFGEILRQQWLQIGVDLNVNQTEWSTYASDVVSSNFELAYHGVVDQFDPDIHLGRFVSGEINGGNWTNYVNPEYDEVVYAARRIIDDQEKRAELYREAQRIFSEELPSIPIRHSILTMVWDADFQFDFRRGVEYRTLNEAYWK